MANDHSSHSCSYDKSGGHFTSGVILGAAIGAFTAYIMSSPDGKEKAKKMFKEGQKALKELEKRAPDAMEKAKEVTETLSEKVHETIENVKDSKEANEQSSEKRFFKQKGKRLSSLW